MVARFSVGDASRRAATRAISLGPPCTIPSSACTTVACHASASAKSYVTACASTRSWRSDSFRARAMGSARTSGASLPTLRTSDTSGHDGGGGAGPAAAGPEREEEGGGGGGGGKEGGGFWGRGGGGGGPTAGGSGRGEGRRERGAHGGGATGAATASS